MALTQYPILVACSAIATMWRGVCRKPRAQQGTTTSAAVIYIYFLIMLVSTVSNCNVPSTQNVCSVCNYNYSPNTAGSCLGMHLLLNLNSLQLQLRLLPWVDQVFLRSNEPNNGILSLPLRIHPSNYKELCIKLWYWLLWSSGLLLWGSVSLKNSIDSVLSLLCWLLWMFLNLYLSFMQERILLKHFFSVCDNWDLLNEGRVYNPNYLC